MRPDLQFATVMVSCEERRAVREATLAGLAKVGWTSTPEIITDDGRGGSRVERIHRAWRQVIQLAGRAKAAWVLLLEDDLVFNKWFTHNLLSWPLLQKVQPGGALYASLYNPSRPLVQHRQAERYAVAHAASLWGAQALVMTPAMARFIDANWDQAEGNPDQRMPLLASRVTPIYLHLPSLVDHAPVKTTWGGIKHSAPNFDREWRAWDPRALAGKRGGGRTRKHR